MDLIIATRAEGGRTVVALSGEIDVYSGPALRERFIDLARAGCHHLVVDLQEVEFLDSTGLGVLVNGLKRARGHDGSMHLVCSREPLLKILRVTGLTKVFPIHDTLTEALAAPD